MEKVKFQIEKMSCGNCENIIKEAVEQLDGVSFAHVNLSDRKATVEYDETKLSVEDIVHQIEEAGYVVL